MLAISSRWRYPCSAQAGKPSRTLLLLLPDFDSVQVRDALGFQFLWIVEFRLFFDPGHDHRLGQNRCSLDGAELAKRNPGSSGRKDDHGR